MKKSVLDTEISCVQNIYKQGQPSKVNLLTWLKSTKHKDKVIRIRQTADLNLKKELKKELPAITPSGLFSKKLKQEHLIRHSGLICLDIDGKDNLHILNYCELKGQLIKVPQVAYCGQSVSGDGYFVLIPIEKPSQHEVHYRALIEDFKAQGLILDAKCININRLRFYSYDPDAYYNHNAMPYSIESRLDTRQVSKHTYNAHDSGQYNEELAQKFISQIIATHVDITSDPEDWIKIAYAFASMGEQGRNCFHSVSAYYPKYDPNECDRTFSSCLRNKKGTVSIGSFIYVCKKYGLTGIG